MGLAFVDLLVLLMEGRGGRFEELPDGGLRYLPSGAEPRLWAGSRRGVPYHSKITSTLRGDAAGEPAFFTADAVAALLDAPGELDFRAQLWPLIAKDAGYAYYRELFTGYPERVRIGWQEFAERFAAADWYSQDRQPARRRVRPGRRAPPGPRTAGPSLRGPRFRRPRGRPGRGGSVHRPRP